MLKTTGCEEAAVRVGGRERDREREREEDKHHACISE